ncbi:PREDICTED: ras-related protein RABA4b [Camelina sativa]|uniref:Ras-related protein RABA4b n=1 Tax=Camelina sativa TaxID=90675 RepID=A0ABM0Y556_CAMSA|nr:PREDICTED: ras-related protein RABA4b [Camelina sativa]
MQIVFPLLTYRYRSVKIAFYKNAMGALIVYDITKEWWLKELRDYTNRNNVTIMLVGNKSDFDDRRQVSTEEGKSFAEREKLLFIETSALDVTNIKEGFKTLMSQIYNNVTSP